MSWQSKAEDVIDKHRELVKTWIADAEWRPGWADVIPFIRQRFAGRFGMLEVMARISDPWQGNRSFRPLLDLLRGEIEQRIERIVSVSPDELPPRLGAALGDRLLSMDSGWDPGDPDSGTPEWRDLALSMTDAEHEAADHYLERDDLPVTSAEAREWYLAARSAYTRQRIAVRHDHRKRDELRRELLEVTWTFWSTLLNGTLSRCSAFESDDEAARASAEQLLADSLARLAALDGRADISEFMTAGAEASR